MHRKFLALLSILCFLPILAFAQGTNGVSGPISIPDGTTNCSTIGMAFSSDTDTGIVRNAANTIGLCSGGVLRALLGSTGFVGSGADNYCADAGVNDTYTCTVTPALTSYTIGARYCFSANTANTGAATINLNGLGAITIKKMTDAITTDLADNDIRANQRVCMIYDGTNMQMMSQLGNAAGGGGGAPTDATYITQTANATLTAEQALGLLATGYVKVMTTTGVLSSQAIPIPVADGGSGLTAGTSGGILGYTAAGTLASSALLTANALVLGGGAGATPTALGSLGTTTTVLHGNAVGPPTFGAVSLTADVSGILPGANGGTGNGFFAVAGLTTSLKTFTFPDASSTVAVTSNNLSVFATTTSAQLAGVISDETGSGVLVFATTPTFTTNLTSPLIIGGTGATSTLSLRSTSGIGAAGADIIFQTGDNGATEAARIFNNGTINVGSTLGGFTGVYALVVNHANGGLIFNRIGGTPFIRITQDGSGGGQIRGNSAGGFLFTDSSAATTWLTIADAGETSFTPGARTSGSTTVFALVAGSDTALTSGTEVLDVYFDLSRTKQHTGSATPGAANITTQRDFLIDAATHSFSSTGAQTITNATTLAIAGPPVAGTNATITTPVTLWVQSGVTRLDGAITTTSTFKSTAASDLGWTVQNATNQACNTTCTNGACVIGIDTVTTGFLACTDATADSCLCAG